MIKKMKVCECDVCGKLEVPDYQRDPFDFHTYGYLPKGWEYLSGKKDGMCMCQECAEAFHKTREERKNEHAN